MPVAGYCLVLVYGAEKLNAFLFPFRHFKLWILRGCLLAVVIRTFGLKSLYRNLDWQDEGRLFLSGLVVCPLNATQSSLYNIGRNAADRGLRLRDVAIDRYGRKGPGTESRLRPGHEQFGPFAQRFEPFPVAWTAEDWLDRSSH